MARSMTAHPVEADSSTIVRVRKMLAKAERTDNEHEAEAFLAKAAQLIADHRISPEQLKPNDRSDATMAVSEIRVGRGAYVRGRISLLVNIAEAHDVRSVYQPTPTGSIAFLAGRAPDVELVEVLYTALHAQASKYMADIRRPTGASTQRERRAFLFGFANRIGELLEQSNRKAHAAASAVAGSASVDLAVRDRRAEVDDFATQQWGRVRSATRPRPVSPAGYEQGEAAADRADIGRSGLRSRRAIGR